MALAFSITTSQAVIYGGWLSTAPGADGTLFGTHEWSTGDTTGATFAWLVTDEEDDCTGWHYSYTLTVLGKDISHVITEVSDTFEDANILGGGIAIGVVGDGDPELKSISENGLTYGPGGSNSGMLGSMSAIKMDVDGDTKTFTWSFCSDRVPVWGDIYAVGGKKPGEEVHLYNSGFNCDGVDGVDTDPDDPAGNGSIQNHILVPNSVSDPRGDSIPEPSTSLLGIIGLMMILRRRMK
jgi:hypothetical protein